MAVQQNKVSKHKKRLRQDANRYQGLEAGKCPNCGAARMPHRVCAKCGQYNGKQVIGQ
jgi:large subunit ribosomal protein L32